MSNAPLEESQAIAEIRAVALLPLCTILWLEIIFAEPQPAKCFCEAALRHLLRPRSQTSHALNHLINYARLEIHHIR